MAYADAHAWLSLLPCDVVPSQASFHLQIVPELLGEITIGRCFDTIPSFMELYSLPICLRLFIHSHIHFLMFHLSIDLPTYPRCCSAHLGGLDCLLKLVLPP